MAELGVPCEIDECICFTYIGLQSLKYGPIVFDIIKADMLGNPSDKQIDEVGKIQILNLSNKLIIYVG